MHFHFSRSVKALQRGLCDRLRSPGFTLVEILIVITVMLLLLTIAGTGASGMLDTLRMKEGMATMRDTMEQARQAAIISNREVIVRIYKTRNEFGEEFWRGLELGVMKLVTDPDAPGYENPSAPGYKPKFERVRAVENLPGGLAFHPSPNYSLLLDSSQTELEKGLEQGPDGVQREYISFRFSPDGSCNLPTSRKWTLTLLKASDLKTGSLPPNYATMQLDPATARVRIYRP